MRFKFSFLKYTLGLAVLTLLTACGGGGSDTSVEEKPQEPPQEELFILTASGPDSVYSWQPIDVIVTTNKADSEYSCLWSYDRMTWTSSPHNSCSHVPTNISEDTIVTLQVTGYYQGEELSFEQDIVINYQYYINHDQRVVAEHVLLTQNQSINLADISFNLVEQVVNTPTSQTKACQTEGNYTLDFYDNNTDLLVSVGDVIQVDFQSCSFDSMDTLLDGQLVINIEQLSAAEQPSELKVMLAGLNIDVDSFYQTEVLTITGDFSAVRSQSELKIITNLSADALEFWAPNEQPLRLTNLNTEKRENYQTGQLQLQMSVNIEQTADTGAYSVDYISPIIAPFGSFPIAGQIKITNLENSEDVLFIETVESHSRGDVFRVVDIEQGVIALNAANRNGSAAYRLSALDNIYINNYVENELRLLGISSPKYNYEVMDSFTLVLSQPISSVEGQAIFYENNVNGNRVTGSTEFLATKVTVTPDDFLQAGSAYSLSLPTLTSQTGVSASYLSTDILISDNIVPVISMSQGYFSELSAPILSASQSELNKGTEPRFLWQAPDNINVTFDTPNELETAIEIGADVTQDIDLQLTVTNELGNRAIVKSPLRYLDINASYMLIIGTEESYVAQGQTWPLNEKDGEFILKTKPYDEAEKSQSFISIDYHGLDSWSLDVAAPAGETLKIGRYEGATRYPFQDDAVAGLDFGGQAKGCNESFSDFEIYQIEFDSEMNLIKLALDFDLACEQSTRKRLQGTVRINSDYPMMSN
ncbi:hypothetical protein SAMN05216262_10790 [Colwellia chukchiensis]|uniref:Ig-like domain-containing protein n=1 Tax=Colwellia chukchiensis TaxID=641665 RepID=A0A1H7NC24_9GAMM|nr:hypothetical protein [Colwellia chukchiensis]SEL20829.1 hypothetical protein SAMN05216262_10790 [Colwellia chukchiensis]